MVGIKNFFKWIGTMLGTIAFGGIAIWHILICISVIIIFITMGMAMFLPEHTEEKKEDLGGIQEMYED